MKFNLPNEHGLSSACEEYLVFKEGGRPSLSDVQYDSLAAGVARCKSLLVVSPTSTGKTQIALWAIAKSIETGCRTVYLVTHRALARQKFDDFKKLLLEKFLASDAASLVIATGDYVEDAEGEVPTNPLQSVVLIATYEKYLAMLSASGIPNGMSNTVVVCDEIQLLGDEHRGQSVEVLLTLLRNAGWKQFVGLSAVLELRDARYLADWLGVELIIQNTREKHLRYECWTHGRIIQVSTDNPEYLKEEVCSFLDAEIEVIGALKRLFSTNNPPVPVIVFCMTKKNTYELASKFVEATSGARKGQLSLAFEGLPETSASSFLAKVLEYGVASHNADLTDDERNIVEQQLAAGKLKVVFATSTLAAGVNFPLGAAIFDKWTRWDSNQRAPIPIDASEFHNMAGRVGRMGFEHKEGRVIFFASRSSELNAARQYLNLGVLSEIEPRVQPARFNQLALQLVASNLCADRFSVKKLICGTFSALREADRNNKFFLTWESKIDEAITGLVQNGLLLETNAGALKATPIGRSVGHSGLLPQSAIFLLEFLVGRVGKLVSMLSSVSEIGDAKRFAIVVFAACLSCPEFRPLSGDRATRSLPYPLGRHALFNADPYKSDLVEPVWQADVSPINAAWLAWRWIEGEKIGILEKEAPDLAAGMLRELFRNLIWVLQGFSSIVSVAIDKRVPVCSRPKVLRVDDAVLEMLSRIPRAIGRLSYRLSEGLPDDLLWMTGLCSAKASFRLTREEILALKENGLGNPQNLMQGSAEADAARLKTFSKVKPSPHAKANWVRDACRAWKANERQLASERQNKRAKNCKRVDLVSRYYKTVGVNFEQAFEEVLSFLKIKFCKLDDKTKTGAPDYLVEFVDMPPLVVELKSREESKLIDYNKAVEVLAASEIHGHREAFCVTLCHPGVDPSVSTVIAACGRLCVVESGDLGEALLRYCEGSLTDEQLYRWLTIPGQALSEDLPFIEYA